MIIVFLTILISALGIGLLAILFIRIRTVDAELKLQKHRSKEEGLSDLLIYAAEVDDGIIVGKNGSFMAAWMYQAADMVSSTAEQRKLLSDRINQAFIPFGAGWMVNIDAVRRPAPDYPESSRSHFPDPVSQAIDEERRRLFEQLGTMYEGYFVLTVTWLPPLLVQQKFVDLMFDDERPALNGHEQTTQLIAQFKREITALENKLSSAFTLQRLATQLIATEEGGTVTFDDLLSWLHFCVTGLAHPIQLPDNPMYLDALIGGQEMWGGVVPRIGEHYIQVVAIDGFPATSYPGILNALAELPVECRWSSRFIFMDPHEAEAHLTKFRSKWKQKVRGLIQQVFNTQSGVVNQDAVDMVHDADQALRELNSNLVAYGYYTSVLVLMATDRAHLDEAARVAAKRLNQLGFSSRIETINTLDAYVGSLPGHGVQNVRRPLINTLNFADLIPSSTNWTGHVNCPCPLYPSDAPTLMHCVTAGATPFRLNLHVRDLGHTIMFGPTGAGKSTHLGILVAQLRRYAGMTIFAFDKGMSLYPLTSAVEGKHFAVAADESTLNFCPLQFLESKEDRAWALDWLDTILNLNGVIPTPAQRNTIAGALQSMSDSGAVTLSEFVTTVQDHTIREVLRQYTIDGAMGSLLDADKDGLTLSSLTTFEIETLMNLGERFALPVLLYLFRRIECHLNGQPSAIILDEAWLMLGHPVFKEKIREWLKVLRKANCFVLMATQSLSDATNSGILDVIIESTATKIFLPNPHARDEDAKALYRRLGLNYRQIEILANAVPKKQYYYVSESGRRLYELALGPLALAFIGASDKESIAEIQSLERQYGQEWIAYWLADKGLDLNDYMGVIE